MPIEIVKLFSIILSLVGSAPNDAPKTLQLKVGDTIVSIGDSITQGGGYLRYAHAAIDGACPELKIPDFINAGIGGQKAEDLIARFENDVVKRKPTFVTISVGINDVWHRLGEAYDPKVLQNYKANVAKMVDMAQVAGIKVILLTPTVITENPDDEGNKRLAMYIAAEKEIAAAKKCQLVDLHRMFLDAIGKKEKSLSLTADGVHMAPPGDAIMALGLLRALGVPDDKLRESSMVTALIKDYGMKGAPAEVFEKLMNPTMDVLPTLAMAVGDKRPQIAADAVSIMGLLVKNHPEMDKAVREALDTAIKTNRIAEATAFEFRRQFVGNRHAYIRNWRMIGPFGNEQCKGYDLAYPPEREPVDFKKSYTGVIEQVSWKLEKSEYDFVDVHSRFKPTDWVVAYAVCWLKSPTAQKAVIEMGSDDGCKVWVNWELVLNVHEHRAASPASNKATVNLKAGWNELLVKIENGDGGWGFYIEAVNPDGSGPMPGIELSTDRPE